MASHAINAFIRLQSTSDRLTSKAYRCLKLVYTANTEYRLFRHCLYRHNRDRVRVSDRVRNRDELYLWLRRTQTVTLFPQLQAYI